MSITSHFEGDDDSNDAGGTEKFEGKPAAGKEGCSE